jgi:hypothetical protein
LQAGAILATALIDRGDARRRPAPQWGEQPDPERKGDDEREQQRDDDGEVANPEQMGAPQDRRRQHGDEEQPGHGVGDHVEGEAGTGTSIVRHDPSLPTARILTGRRFYVAFVLLVIVIAALVYVGWRVVRAAAKRPQTRVIGPDDDPDFLRRINPRGDQPRS